MSTENPKRDITALREHLFATIEGVKSGRLDLDKARAVNELSKTLVDTARVEVDFLRQTDGLSSGFLEVEGKKDDKPAPGVTQHRLR